MDVFAITGRTGSGKTTIMDAMCLALYGRVPRGTDVTRLVANGAQTMYVALEFEAGGREFRAIRRIDISRTTQKAGPTRVQLERRGDDGEWEPIENRVREMNDAIEGIVGLDYRSFTRCVLLPQGRFQEMLTGDPKERREILEELLDIGVYKTIMESANRRARDIDAQAAAIERVLQTTLADATPETLALRRDELAAAKPELKTARQRREALQQAVQHASEVRAARRAEHERRGQAEEKGRALAKAETIAAEGQQALRAIQAQLGAAEEEAGQLSYDRLLHTRLIGARAKAEEAQRVSVQAAAAHSLASDRRALADAEAALAKATAASEAAKGALAEAEIALKTGRDAHSAAHLRTTLRPGVTCPVCGAKVGKLPGTPAPALGALERADAAARKAEEAASRKLKDAALRHAREAQNLKNAVEQAEALAAELARLGAELAAAVPVGVAPDVEAIRTRLTEIDALGTRYDELTKRIADLRSERDKRDRAVAASAANIEGLRAEVRSLNAAADEDRARGDEAIAALAQMVKRWQWGDVVELIEGKRDPSPALAEMLDRTQRDCDALERRIGALEEETKRIERDIKQAEERRVEVESLRARMRSYATLADLLQANRFRDWYIGEAMALLAAAATERLRTLDPDQRYALGVERGEFIVLDRWQAGAARSPDTLSGGETFVVSLALAFALAEQLPQIQLASAAPLDSLFLDEGFGTLDPDTLDPIFTALDELRMEGRLVGVITHVQELAERIGTRIEVTKAPEGSTVTVVAA
jgi:exonuclease SbcC